MIDDFLAEVFGEAVLGRLGSSRRAQLLARMGFGLLGGGLGIGGAVHFALREGLTKNVALHASVTAMLFFLGCFWLFNVAFARTWRWPGIAFVLSFVSMFVTRILLGP